VKSLEIRNETLVRVARAIVSHQQEFLERGEAGHAAAGAARDCGSAGAA
jgi:DNA-directed RNA polymerase specialized sigma54-like protein